MLRALGNFLATARSLSMPPISGRSNSALLNRAFFLILLRLLLFRFVANPDFRPVGAGLKLRGRRRDGTMFHVEISLSPVSTEQGVLISPAVRDISGRVQQR